MLKKIMIRHPQKLIFVIVLTFLSCYLYSLENNQAPFVTKLTLESIENKVLLTWKNPDSFNNNISIYRSNEVINTVNRLRKAIKIEELENGEEKYIDRPNQHGKYYYAIIITKKDTRENINIFVPYRNYTLEPVSISEIDFFKITGIKAISKKTYISIEWSYNKESSGSINVMVYRNTTPIRNTELLSTSTKIATIDIETGIYIDVPVPDINYYYAVFIENDREKEFIYDLSYTTSPVNTEFQSEHFDNFLIQNFIPLPLLALNSDPKTGQTFLDPQILKHPGKISYSHDTKKIIYAIKTEYNDILHNFMKAKQDHLKQLPFKLLNNEEIFEPKEFAVEYTLAHKYITEEKYMIALRIFETIQEEMVPEDYQRRLSYYIGMIYYIKGNYYNAYINLIHAYDLFDNEIKSYLESIYLNIFNTLER